MWRTIAVGDDGSAESAVALACARHLTARLGATLRACSVVGPASLSYRELSRMDVSDAVAQRAYEEHRRLERSGGVEVDVLQGDAGEALTELSREVDLIVIGSRGQGPWGRLMTGSTGAYLARHAVCPLLILPRGLAASSAPAPGGRLQILTGPQSQPPDRA
jgi:nucleotide-binding universal stress UspA family protein